MRLHLNGLNKINPDSFLVIGSLFACLFWFIDSAIKTFVFENQRLYLESLLRPETVDLWMRCQIIFLIMSISLIAMLLLRRQHRITRELQQYKRELEDIVYERTSDLSMKNAMLEKEIMERLKIEADLLHLATVDPLTSIPNRRKFNEVLEYELKRATRYHNELSLIMCDLDHFKNINDKHGHNVGDEVLKEFSQIITNNIRQTDVFARWGGEEFALLLPSTDAVTAIQMAEKLRSAIEQHTMPCVDTLTASFGVTQVMKGDNETKFINRADDALYKAKKSGRNAVMFLPPVQMPLKLLPVKEASLEEMTK